MEKFDGDAVLIGYNKKNFSLQLETLAICGKRSKKAIDKLRESKKDKYEGKVGKRYAIAFYDISGEKLKVTDFFRAVLVDPKFYVKNLMIKSNIMAIVADEFILNEVWKSKARKGTDVGNYSRLVEMLNLFWKDATDLTDQTTKEYFNKHVTK